MVRCVGSKRALPPCQRNHHLIIYLGLRTCSERVFSVAVQFPIRRVDDLDATKRVPSLVKCALSRVCLPVYQLRLGLPSRLLLASGSPTPLG
jgi:hypothetical protein